MKKTTIILVIVVLASVLLVTSGCKEESAPSTAKPAGQSPSQAQTDAVPAEVYNEYRDLEVVPSGDQKCFLSACDCVCYTIPNVPASAKKVGCATNCTKTYRIKGCRFTNYQCFSVK